MNLPTKSLKQLLVELEFAVMLVTEPIQKVLASAVFSHGAVLALFLTILLPRQSMTAMLRGKMAPMQKAASIPLLEDPFPRASTQRQFCTTANMLK